MTHDWAPFNPRSQDTPHPRAREHIKEEAVQKYQQSKMWKLALVVLLGCLLIYVFYRLFKDSTSTAIRMQPTANDLVRQGINLKNFVDLI